MKEYSTSEETTRAEDDRTVHRDGRELPAMSNDGARYIKIRTSEFYKQQVMKNLLTALERTAKSGDSRGSIRLSRYILKLSNDGSEEFIEVSSEGNQQRGCDPINQLQ